MSDESQKREEERKKAAALEKELAELATAQTRRRNDFLSVLTSLEEAETKRAACDVAGAWGLSAEHRAVAEATMVRKLRTEHVARMCWFYFEREIRACCINKGSE